MRRRQRLKDLVEDRDSKTWYTLYSVYPLASSPRGNSDRFRPDLLQQLPRLVRGGDRNWSLVGWLTLSDSDLSCAQVPSSLSYLTEGVTSVSPVTNMGSLLRRQFSPFSHPFVFGTPFAEVHLWSPYSLPKGEIGSIITKSHCTVVR